MALIRYIYIKEWEITTLKFWAYDFQDFHGGPIWSKWQIPLLIKTHIHTQMAAQCLTLKKEVQHLVGLFGYWRQGLPHYGMCCSVYGIALKTASYEWGSAIGPECNTRRPDTWTS